MCVLIEKKSKVLFFSFLLLFLSVFKVIAQSPQEFVEGIKSDREKYLWGEATGDNFDEADRQALYILTSQISLSVEAQFEEVVEWGQGTEFKEKLKNVVNTYANATLNNAERIVLEEDPNARVFRYIKKEDIAKIFEARTKKIQEFVTNADKYVAERKISDALRYYYWGLLLLKSHPAQHTLTYLDDYGKNPLFSVYIPIKINEIFSDLSFKTKNNEVMDDLQIVEMAFYYKKQPVHNIDYSYFTGRNWTNPITAIDGIGIFEFKTVAKESKNKTKIRIEYDFKHEVRMDEEVEEVMNSVKNISFSNNASFIVNFNQTSPVKSSPLTSIKEQQQDLVAKTKAVNLNNHQVEMVEITPYLENLGIVLNLIKTKNFQKLYNYCTSDGLEVVQKLFEFGNAHVMNYHKLEAHKFENNVKVAAIPMRFSFRSNSKEFIEKVVFHFDENKKVHDITFALSQQTNSEIMAHNRWPHKNKMTIINFLEHYKTAYALKRIDYIESIFSDDALIIVGRVVEQAASLENPYSNNKIIKFNKYTKRQFIKNLGYSFNKKAYVNLRFEDVYIRRSGVGGEVYGIQIKQHYFSSNYGDTGYLFLLADLSNPNKPMIHVRTWQPEKSLNGAIYNISDF